MKKVNSCVKAKNKVQLRFFEIKMEQDRCRRWNSKLKCKKQHKYRIQKETNNREGIEYHIDSFPCKKKSTIDVLNAKGEHERELLRF